MSMSIIMYSKTRCGVLLALVLPSSVSAGAKHWTMRSLSQDHRVMHHFDTQVIRRQTSLPPYTTQAVCPKYDGYFYVTPGNSTFQIQCDTVFNGQVLGQQDASSYAECISGCEYLNNATGPGICEGVTFSGTSDQARGSCTGYTKITSGSPAPDSSMIYDSALLIYGPDGTEYAIPDDTPTTSSTTTQLLTSSSTRNVPGTTSSSSTTKPSSSTTSSTTSSSKTSTSIAVTTSSSFSVPIAGPRPLDPVSTDPTSAQSYPGTITTSSFTTTSNLGNQQSAQRTFSTTIPFTVVEVHVTEVCQTTPTPCSTSIRTTTVTGNRLQISCSPGPCDGLLSNSVAAVDAAICVVAP